MHTQVPVEKVSSLKSAVEGVEFSRKQMDWLERMYPEMLDTNATDSELRARAAQRLVLYNIRGRVK